MDQGRSVIRQGEAGHLPSGGDVFGSDAGFAVKDAVEQETPIDGAGGLLNPRPAMRRCRYGVIQEVYGYLCVHYAIRWLMHSAATDYEHDPDRLSFIPSLCATRRTTKSHAGFPCGHR